MTTERPKNRLPSKLDLDELFRKVLLLCYVGEKQRQHGLYLYERTVIALQLARGPDPNRCQAWTKVALSRTRELQGFLHFNQV